MKLRFDAGRDALIAVDVQNDFCPGGALPVPDGDRVVPVINALLQKPWRLKAATRDWHPPNHCSFKPQGGIWPVHCVADTKGAGFHPALDAGKIDVIISKATAPEVEAYSGFERTDLASLLRKSGVRRVFVTGLATDYCVKATVLDALRGGFEVVVVQDACRGVEVNPGDCAKALDAMKASGAILAASAEIG